MTAVAATTTFAVCFHFGRETRGDRTARRKKQQTEHRDENANAVDYTIRQQIC